MTDPDPAHQVVNKPDSDLWLAYANKVKALLAPEGLGSDGTIFMTAIGAQGIAAGTNVPEPIKNLGVYDVGNNLLNTETPVFIPGGESYYDYVDAYVHNVNLVGDLSPGQKDALDRAKKKLDAAVKAENGEYKAALADYKQRIAGNTFTGTFSKFVDSGFAEAYREAMQERQDAAEDEQAILNKISGNDAPRLNKTKRKVEAAGDSSELKPGIDNSYDAEVDDWIARFDTAQPTNISFKVSEGQSSSWNKHGFDELKVHVAGSLFWFINASFDMDDKTETSHISAAQATQDITVTISTRGQGVFGIHPDHWDTSVTDFQMHNTSLPPILTKPAIRVEKVLMAYGVSMDIDLESSLATQVHDLVDKAKTMSGSASISFFGLNIGGSFSSTSTSTITFDDIQFQNGGTRIHIPADNSAFPTMLAVLGRKLDLPQ
ncbi:hypothetical protein K469DRAFT_751202 [Zopfia rhizophila CBS 207.26]|uniref:Uncharacterized protein n=1 Tax=Zopfia rhizophila CBS 207.26 TaxID=1314779 RepID=A0A6A6DZJ7_9PEZI|nr:hypothetical protein K469DRAFT_751202 [Zopfia rhizophila CBS 207.26]